VERPAWPLVIAHRGASGTLPENTFPAYQRALEERADMIEIDVHRTRDGALVVTHDAGLARIGGRGEVGDCTLAEVRALDAGGGEPVPILGEVLDRFGPRIPFNLEFKWGGRGDYAEIEAETLEAVSSRGLLDRTLFSSFHDAILARLRALSPAARTALLLSARNPGRGLERARALGAEAINPSLAALCPEMVRAAHGEGLAVHVYTVDAEDDMRRLLDWGVDGLFTNFPARLRSLLDAAS
jgi:glycerophosphoryl diester phosphodiesterase